MILSYFLLCQNVNVNIVENPIIPKNMSGVRDSDVTITVVENAV